MYFGMVSDHTGGGLDDYLGGGHPDLAKIQRGWVLRYGQIPKGCIHFGPKF